MLLIPIDRSSGIPLTGQVYQFIRKQTLNGTLKAGEKLPSSRELACFLSVSRNIILAAYDQLMIEGFIVTRKGAGTFIAEGTYLEKAKPCSFRNILKHSNKKSLSDIIDFRSGIPALDLFPRKTWAKLSNSIWHETSASTFGYGAPEGRIELREVISHYLHKTRRVICHPDQIVVTSGAVQAITLVSNLLLSPNEEILIEDPITKDIQTILKKTGALLYPIPVDTNGIKTSLLPTNKKPKFIFFTPSHQFPLGGTLPIQRQVKLINYAKNTNCYLVEDDYDSEFRYEHSPVSSLQGLAPERVIYIGSFSKILSPALRMGYLILPSHLIKTCRNLKWFSDLHTPSVDQLILAQFLAEGHLERHTSKMKKVYKKRRDFLISQLKETFSDKVTIYGDSTGLHLIAEFNEINFTEQTTNEMVEKYRIKVYPVEEHAIKKGKHLNKIILGYGHLSNEEISVGIHRLKEALVEI